MRTGIVGGGLTGMALALRLAERGDEVDVIERESQIGGLATHHDFGGFRWDRFYHVILPSDRHLIGFLNDLGLGDQLEWKRTRTGFWVDGRMHSVSNAIEFLRFPPLGLLDKARLAFTLLYSARIEDWRRLEKIPVDEWLIRVSGRRTYERMWKPLLVAKLGEDYHRASAVFIWAYIKRMFSARDSSAGKEQLGHVRGGYEQVFGEIRSRIEGRGGRVRTSTTVAAIRPDPHGGIEVEFDGTTPSQRYDRVVCTGPVPVLESIADPTLLEIESGGDGTRSIEYMGVVCPVLVTTREVVPYYVVNIADPEVPFSGMIGMNSVVDPRFTGGRHLTYLPKYVPSDDEWFERDDELIVEAFLRGVRRMVPDFDPSSLERVVVNRARRVQPLQVRDFSKIVPTVTTTHPSFFVLNTAQFVTGTVNNNSVIRAVDDFVAELDARREGATDVG